MIDTNVFIHAANHRDMNTKKDEAISAKSVIATLIATCHPFLFSIDTLEELLKKFRDLEKNKLLMDYDVVKDVNMSVRFAKDEKGNAKAEYCIVNESKDEIEDLISHKKDRKFIYLMRDYNYLGRKYLITSDVSDFILKDQKMIDLLNNYKKRYNFEILTPNQVIEMFEASLNAILMEDSQ